jgi:MFS family permease
LYSVVAILYFAKVSGSYALGMSIFSLIMLSSAFFEMPTGVLSDFIGRKKTMVLGAVAGLLAVIIFALSNSYSVLVFGAIFQGLSRSLFSGNNSSLLHDTLKEKNHQLDYSKWLGKISALSQLGSGFAAVVGSVLASYSFKLMMWASVLPLITTVVIALFVREPKSEQKVDGNIFAHLSEAIKLFKTNSKLRLFSIVKIWFYSVDEAAYVFNSVFIETVWPIWAIGLLKMISKFLGTVIFAFSGRIITLIGDRRIIFLRSIWDHLTRFTALLFPSVFSPILMSSNKFLWATGQVAENSLLQKEFTDHQRSTMGSLVSFVESISFAILAFVLGYVGDLYGPVIALLALQFGKIPIVFLIRKLYLSEK